MSIDRTALSESLKLRALLRQLPDEQLKRISKNWGFADGRKENLEGLSGDSLADYLYPRMNSEKYFQQMWDSLTEDERDTLKFLAVHGGMLSRDELAQRMFKGAVRSFRRVVESLLDKGLCFEATDLPGISDTDGQWLFMPEAFVLQVDLPVHCQGFLGSLLRRMTTDELAAMAQRVLGLEEFQLPSPLELCYRIRNWMLDPENLRAAINGLPETEREIFDDVMARKGQCLYRDLLDATGAKKVDHSKAEHINSLAQTSGLLFTVKIGHNKYMNQLAVPKDLYYVATRRFQPDLRSLQRIETMAGVRRDAPALPGLDNSQDLMRDVAVFLARLDMFQPKKLASGGINKADLKKVAAMFSGQKQQSGYAALLSTFAIDSGEFVDVAGNWRASETLPLHLGNCDEFYMRLFQWWLKTVIWNELYLDGLAPAGERPPQLWTDIVELKQVILLGLRSVQKDRWVDFSSFYETVTPALEASLTRGSGGGGYGGILSVKDAVSVIIRDSLQYLGVTVIANDGSGEENSAPARYKIASARGKAREAAKADTVAAGTRPDFQFKLSTLGRKLINSEAVRLTYDLENEGNPVAKVFAQEARWIIVQPNLDVVAPRDLALDVTFQLSRLCSVKNLDVMTTLELSRDSLRPALDRGAEKNSIISFLSNLSRVELPASVSQLVEEADTKHGEVRLGSSSGYIIADNQVVLESIWRHPKLSAYVKERHGEGVLLLASDADINKLARELRNQGHSPQLETGVVHSNAENRFHLSLSELEMQDVIAAVRLLAHVERVMETDLSDNRAASLAHRLQPDSTGFLVSGTGVETRSRQIIRRFEAAFTKHNEEIVDKYKSQVSKLVSRSLTSRGPSKFQYKGVNPAIEKEDIEQLLKFAQDYELEVELLYVKQNEQETRVTVAPRGIEGERIYAHNPVTDTDAIYALARILRARLL